MERLSSFCFCFLIKCLINICADNDFSHQSNSTIFMLAIGALRLVVLGKIMGFTQETDKIRLQLSSNEIRQRKQMKICAGFYLPGEFKKNKIIMIGLFFLEIVILSPSLLALQLELLTLFRTYTQPHPCHLSISVTVQAITVLSLFRFLSITTSRIVKKHIPNTSME